MSRILSFLQPNSIYLGLNTKLIKCFFVFAKLLTTCPTSLIHQFNHDRTCREEIQTIDGPSMPSFSLPPLSSSLALSWLLQMCLADSFLGFAQLLFSLASSHACAPGSSSLGTSCWFIMNFIFVIKKMKFTIKQ